MLEFFKNLFGGNSVSFAELMNNGAQIIDVRTETEFSGGHIKILQIFRFKIYHKI